MRRGGHLSPGRPRGEPALPAAGARRSLAAHAADAARHAEPRPALRGDDHATTPTATSSSTPTRKLGTVSEVFRLNHRGKAESLMREYAGRAAIGHVRYATCGGDDRSYAQPFERHHLQKHKWFAFAFNGQLANYAAAAGQAAGRGRPSPGPRRPTPKSSCTRSAASCRGDRRPRAGRRDAERAASGSTGRTAWCCSTPRATCSSPATRWASSRCATPIEGPLFAAASESVALLNLGFRAEIDQVAARRARRSRSSTASSRSSGSPTATRAAHCFFEWIYFANVASTLDDRSVYLVAQGAGRGAGPAGDGAARATTRSSCRCPTPARRRPTRWPTRWACRASRG